MMMKSNSTYLSTIFVQCPCGQQRVALLRRNTGPGHTAQHAGKHRKPVPPATHSFHSKYGNAKPWLRRTRVAGRGDTHATGEANARGAGGLGSAAQYVIDHGRGLAVGLPRRAAAFDAAGGRRSVSRHSRVRRAGPGRQRRECRTRSWRSRNRLRPCASTHVAVRRRDLSLGLDPRSLSVAAHPGARHHCHWWLLARWHGSSKPWSKEQARACAR